jgi:hypothetical protein
LKTNFDIVSTFISCAIPGDRGGNLQIIAWDSKNESLPIQRVQAGVKNASGYYEK